jgi:phospholipid/cholesterol/gamma-HCH transport system substrate-binding protein
MSYELRIGLLAAICIAVTVWGYKFLKGKNMLVASNYYYAEYNDIDELSATSPVLIRGLRVGTVSEVRLTDDMEGIIATLDIDKGLRIPKNTEALIVNTSIMGGKAVVLDVKGPCSGDDCAKRGDTLPGRVEGILESMFGDQDIEGYVQKIKAGLGDLVTDLSDSLSASASGNEFARTFFTLQQVLLNIEKITGQLGGSMSAYDQKMQSIMGNVDVLSATLAKSNVQIASAISNLDSITTDLKNAQVGTTASATIGSLDTAIANADKAIQEFEALLSNINAGEGSLGMLARDRELYENLNETSRQLSLLLQDFRMNPKRYVNVSVFGKKQKDYEVPENDPASQE